MKSSTGCKVYLSLLALCYLEVVLWTSCLFSAPAALAGATDSHSYLLRETGNLKYAGNDNVHFLTVLLQNLHEIDWEAVHAEHSYLQRVQGSAPASSDRLQPALTDLRIPLSEKGLPAPYTGIAAID